jgi:transcriptional regulator with XRE-family HTH domain
MSLLLTLEPCMGFAEQLRLLREAAGLSQQELAGKASISVDSIQNWEQGRTRPRLTALGQFASALGVSLDLLIMGGTGKPDSKRPRGRPKGKPKRGRRKKGGAE